MSQPTGGAQSGATDPTAQSGQTGELNTTGTDPSTGADPAQSGQQTSTQAPETVSRADFEAVSARMQAADRAKAAAEKKLKDIEDAKLSEAERTQQELQAAKAELEAERQKNQQQALENAILMDQTYSGKWHNPKTVLQIIDREYRELITFDDGKPKGVKAALDKLAKDHAYLLKPAEGASDNGTGKGATGASGTSRQHGQATNREQLASKWPAMRGRVASNG